MEALPRLLAYRLAKKSPARVGSLAVHEFVKYLE